MSYTDVDVAVVVDTNGFNFCCRGYAATIFHLVRICRVLGKRRWSVAEVIMIGNAAACFREDNVYSIKLYVQAHVTCIVSDGCIGVGGNIVHEHAHFEYV